MNIQLNTKTKTITLKEKISIDELLDFLYESNIEFDDWSIDFIATINIPFQQQKWTTPNLGPSTVYPYQHDIYCGTGNVRGNSLITGVTTNTTTFVKNVNSTYTK